MPGSGQTLVALGLMRALRQRNLRVQSFKCGPELADLRYHALAADREPVSLDTWLSSRSHLQTVYNRYGEKADVCVVEGRAGLFDGFRKTQGSSAEMARLMKIPVVMVVSARNAGYSTAAMLYGFKHFNTELKIVGVILIRLLRLHNTVSCAKLVPRPGWNAWAISLIWRKQAFHLVIRH